MNFLEILFKFLFLLIASGILFSFLPKMTYIQVKRLLTYHDYKSEVLKKRFSKVIRVYLILGITLGIVFAFLLSPMLSSNMDEIPKEKLKVKNYIELFSLSFLMSFLLMIILRISVLLNKTNILGYILPKKQKNRMKLLEKIYDYEGLRTEIAGFLFSIFLSALLGLIIWFFYNLIFNPTSLIMISFTMNYNYLLNYILFVAGFIAVFIILTWLGELILHFCGVHSQCIDRIKE